jgi:hypothetical protein
MYGDSAAIRRRAGQLREQGTDIRAMAEGLVARLDAIAWQGRAATDLRGRVHDRVAHLRDCASTHETAAECLERHAAEVERLKDAIAGVERKATSLVADARTRIAGFDDADHRVEPSDVDRVLDAFTPPPRGHKDWLTASLPGL